MKTLLFNKVNLTIAGLGGFAAGFIESVILHGILTALNLPTALNWIATILLFVLATALSFVVVLALTAVVRFFYYLLFGGTKTDS